jgi:hypothetical protein
MVVGVVGLNASDSSGIGWLGAEKDLLFLCCDLCGGIIVAGEVVDGNGGCDVAILVLLPCVEWCGREHDIRARC